MKKKQLKKNTKIAILGAGSWGTAIAVHLSKFGHPILLWGQDSKQIQVMKSTKENPYYLPNVTFPELLQVTDDFELCMETAEEIIIAVPSHAFNTILNKINQPKNGIAWLTKGVNPENNQFLSTLVAERWGKDFPIAIISGPSFALEVAQGMPTAIVIAGNNQTYLKEMHQIFHHAYLRVYESNDIIGVQWCGTIKNIIAIACGISDGLNYGANAKAALITRGLAEMSRMGVSLGGKQETFIGLAGIGDLVLTCTDNQSRNRRFGIYLGQGLSVKETEAKIGQVVEGKYNATQVCALSKEFKIEMPICEQVNKLLHGKISPQQAFINLMTRPVGIE